MGISYFVGSDCNTAALKVSRNVWYSRLCVPHLRITPIRGCREACLGSRSVLARPQSRYSRPVEAIFGQVQSLDASANVRLKVYIATPFQQAKIKNDLPICSASSLHLCYTPAASSLAQSTLSTQLLYGSSAIRSSALHSSNQPSISVIARRSIHPFIRT